MYHILMHYNLYDGPVALIIHKYIYIYIYIYVCMYGCVVLTAAVVMSSQSGGPPPTGSRSRSRSPPQGGLARPWQPQAIECPRCNGRLFHVTRRGRLIWLRCECGQHMWAPQCQPCLVMLLKCRHAEPRHLLSSFPCQLGAFLA